MTCKEECHRVRSVGRLSQHVEAMLVDNATGETLSIGQTGELWLRGPSIMLGNHKSSESTTLISFQHSFCSYYTCTYYLNSFI